MEKKSRRKPKDKVIADSAGQEEVWRSNLRVMKDRFNACLDENVFEGVRDAVVYHGLRVTESFAINQSHKEICFCPEKQEYYVLEPNAQVHRYTMQGKSLLPAQRLEASFFFTRMTWCEKIKCLLCYAPDNEAFWLLTSEFLVQQSISCDYTVQAAFYDPVNDLIVAVAQSKVTLYSTKDIQNDLEVLGSLEYNDPEIGSTTWRFQNSSLGFLESKEPFLVASYEKTLYCAPLFVSEELEAGEPIPFLSKKNEASEFPISIVYFHELSSWIVTGDQQGNVIGWDVDLNCLMSISGAHQNSIILIEAHPSICGFLTYCKGEKLQIWSCNFRNKCESIENIGKIVSMVANPSAAGVVTLGTNLTFLTMYQLYFFYAPLTAAAQMLMSTQNPMYPTKVMSISQDSSVRLFSSFHGTQITVQILSPVDHDVTSICYSGNKDLLYTMILPSGEILVSDANARPIKFREVWINDDIQITCMAVYEYYEEIRGKEGYPQNPRIFYEIGVRFFLGSANGRIIVANYETGKHESSCAAHEGAVTQMRVSELSKQMITLGKDNCAKVWKVFADLPEPLVLHHTCFLAETIVHIGIFKDITCIAAYSKNLTYQIIMDNMTARERLFHPPEDDHGDEILDMKTHEYLSICASSSLDRSIKVWSRRNELIITLQINTAASSITFSSIQADLVFACGQHLYQIPHQKYLTPHLRTKLVRDDLSFEQEEKVIPEDKNYKIYENVADRSLMFNPKCKTPLGVLDGKDKSIPRVEKIIQQQNCALMDHRDQDMKNIKKCRLKILPLLKYTRAVMTEEEWDRYVTDQLFLVTHIQKPAPLYPVEDYKTNHAKQKKSFNEVALFQMEYGYHPDEAERAPYLEDVKSTFKYASGSFVPNSVLFRPYRPPPPAPPLTPPPPPPPKKVWTYSYPPEFYETDDEKKKRKSIRLSQL